jgi:peroxiredoxin Q/BCP
MAQLRQDYQKFVERNTEIIAVGPEDAKTFARWWHEHQMPFIGIPDPKHAIARLYNQQFKLLRGGRMPALAVIDINGKVRFMHYADSPGDIPPDEEVLSLLDKLSQEESQSLERPR